MVPALENDIRADSHRIADHAKWSDMRGRIDFRRVRNYRCRVNDRLEFFVRKKKSERFGKANSRVWHFDQCLFGRFETGINQHRGGSALLGAFKINVILRKRKIAGASCGCGSE